jgi:hypothetical protein
MPWRLILVLALLIGGGAAVYLGSVEQPVDFSSVLEIWGDVLRDADQLGLQLTRASDDEEMRLGRDLAARVASWSNETRDGQAYVSEVGKSLLPGLRRKGIRYQFHVLDAPVPNAFVLPGGQVFITTGMFGFLQSEAELASVLGHEMSHVDLRHSIERYQYLLKARKVHFAPVGQLAEIARSLATIEYAKYQELDADAQGVRLSIEAGYDPQAAVDAFAHTASYDAAIFEDFAFRVLPDGTLDRFQKGIGEEGLGIVLVEFVYWPGDLNQIELWMQSTFYNVFAADVIFGSATPEGRVFYDILRTEPIFGVPEVPRWAMNGAPHGDLKAREGATIEANWRGRGTEAVVSRGYGEGQVLQISHGWDNIPSETVIGFEYLPDLIFNELFFVAKVPPPQDLALVHSLRVDLIQLARSRESAIALLDFVDRFGANTMKLESMLGSLDDQVRQGETQYIRSEYAQAQDTLSDAATGYARFSESAAEVKRRALLWIYVIEWVTVAATLMICLQVLWILMIRRRLYRAVASTRAQLQDQSTG